MLTVGADIQIITPNARYENYFVEMNESLFHNYPESFSKEDYIIWMEIETKTADGISEGCRPFDAKTALNETILSPLPPIDDYSPRIEEHYATEENDQLFFFRSIDPLFLDVGSAATAAEPSSESVESETDAIIGVTDKGEGELIPGTSSPLSIRVSPNNRSEKLVAVWNQTRSRRYRCRRCKSYKNRHICPLDPLYHEKLLKLKNRRTRAKNQKPRATYFTGLKAYKCKVCGNPKTRGGHKCNPKV